ncbi:hypothetical protein BCR34DRAFT_597649 [Clohesyomyces aquaticus]|uniref:Extracellular membrane protein CFEM domain-containing protein n=1 Tax=Clohesyomyces aquaticus TaxID=1231657 RepID=A0A1Y2A2L6_9PLEO|nr:hypothetical protein BCR34DRAFT_597649 [Clohesyomyces aquaticus]
MQSLHSTLPLKSLLALLSLFSLLPNIVLSTDPTLGPQAPFSLTSESAFSTARPCAQYCIVYSGPFACGVNRGYNDFAVALGCGCSPQNYCVCGATASASSYISSCVSVGCSAYGNAGDDVSRMVALYNGYCATANKAVSTESPSLAKTTAGTSVTGVNPGIGASVSQVPATGTGNRNSPPTSTSAAAGGGGGGGGDEGGLSKSDIIALASGLGVGVPSLIIAAVALWFQMRKKKGKPEIAIAGIICRWHQGRQRRRRHLRLRMRSIRAGGRCMGRLGEVHRGMCRVEEEEHSMDMR